jgi:fructose-1-phosphate kinase PfkB-like protein
VSSGETGIASDLAEARDALVAGLVPGIALAWSWPDMLRHAVALAASVTASGEADLDAYEELLPSVEVTGPRIASR